MYGWVGQDLECFITNFTYIFADQLSTALNSSGVHVLGAVIGYSLKGQGLLGRIGLFIVLTAFNSLIFSAISVKKDLALAWPLTLSDSHLLYS